VKTAFDKLSTSQTKLGEAIYAQSQQEQAAPAEGAEQPTESSNNEDVVDAEVVDDEDDKK